MLIIRRIFIKRKSVRKYIPNFIHYTLNYYYQLFWTYPSIINDTFYHRIKNDISFVRDSTNISQGIFPVLSVQVFIFVEIPTRQVSTETKKRHRGTGMQLLMSKLVLIQWRGPTFPVSILVKVRKWVDPPRWKTNFPHLIATNYASAGERGRERKKNAYCWVRSRLCETHSTKREQRV